MSMNKRAMLNRNNYDAITEKRQQGRKSTINCESRAIREEVMCTFSSLYVSAIMSNVNYRQTSEIEENQRLIK